MTTVRPIAERDKERWSQLWVDYGVFYKENFGTDVIEGVWAWLLDPNHEIEGIVAVDDADHVIGFALYREHADTFTAGRALFLDDLFVDSAARGAGAGALLLSELAGIAAQRGARVIRWITAHDNATAQRLYDRVATKASWVTYEMAAR